MLMPAHLEPQTLDRLHELVRMNRASWRGFQDAADAVDEPHLAAILQDLARQRRGFAEQLERFAPAADEADEQDAKQKIYRWWQDLRARLTGGQAYAVLAEAERSEDQIRDLYAEVIEQTTDSPVCPVLREQYANILAGHDRIRDLRDAYGGQERRQ